MKYTILPTHTLIWRPWFYFERPRASILKHSNAWICSYLIWLRFGRLVASPIVSCLISWSLSRWGELLVSSNLKEVHLRQSVDASVLEPRRSISNIPNIGNRGDQIGLSASNTPSQFIYRQADCFEYKHGNYRKYCMIASMMSGAAVGSWSLGQRALAARDHSYRRAPRHNADRHKLGRGGLSWLNKLWDYGSCSELCHRNNSKGADNDRTWECATMVIGAG